MDSQTTLFDSWNVKGFFWPIDEGNSSDERDIADRVPGELCFDGLVDGAHLTVLGKWESLESGTWDNSSAENLDGEVVHSEIWLHGRSICGKALTLIGVTPRGGSRNSASSLAEHSNWYVRCVVSNEHLKQTGKLQEMTISFPGLSKFLSQPAQRIFEHHLEEQQETVTVRRTPVEVRVDSLFQGTRIEINLWHRGCIKTDICWSAELDTQSGITIKTDTTEDVYWWFKLIYSLQHFLSTVYGVPVCPDRVLVDRNDFTQAAFWYQFRREQIKQSFNINDLILNCSVVDPDLISKALERWFSMPKEFDAVVQQFFGNFFDPHSKARVDFVFHSQTLEIFHAFLHREESVLGEDQRDIMRMVKSFLRKRVKSKDPEIYRSIQDGLSRVGAPTQRSRLLDLFKSLNSYCKGIFWDDPADFVACVIATRNFYIHGSLPEKDTLLDFEEQTAAVEGLKLAVMLLLLRELGFDGNIVGQRLYGSNEYRKWRSFRPVYLHEEDLRQKVTTKRQ